MADAEDQEAMGSGQIDFAMPRMSSPISNEDKLKQPLGKMRPLVKLDSHEEFEQKRDAKRMPVNNNKNTRDSQ